MRITTRTATIGVLLLVSAFVGAVSLQRPAHAQVAGPGTFAANPVYNSSGLAFAVFGGGSVTQLETAAQVAGASGVWAQDSVGRDVLLVVNGPAFLKAPITAAFPVGFAGPRAVTLVRASASTPPPPAATATATRAASTLGESVAQIVIQQTNVQRAIQGLGPLKADAKLNAEAAAYAQVVFNVDPYFRNVAGAHTHDGTLGDRATRVGYAFAALGENVHWVVESDLSAAGVLATKTVDGWMNSPPHRANILTPTFTETGVGCAIGQPTQSPPQPGIRFAVVCIGVYATPR